MIYYVFADYGYVTQELLYEGPDYNQARVVLWSAEDFEKCADIATFAEDGEYLVHETIFEEDIGEIEYFTIEHNQSGEIIYLGTNTKGWIEILTDKALEEIYDGELQRAPADGYCPTGCGEYTSTTRCGRHVEEYFDWFSVKD